MPNISTTNYVIEGKKEELDALYQKMKELQEMEQPLVENNLGPTWLGCLVKALGKNPEDVLCRGQWIELERQDDKLRMTFIASYLLQSRRTWLRSLFEERCRGQVFP